MKENTRTLLENPAKDAESQDNFSINYQAHAEKYDLKQAAHPRACIFTFLFKAAAILSYLFLNILFDSIFTTIVVILLSAVDFWVVKNITGRLLVGLRWWSEIKEDGSESWNFESKPNNYSPNSVDSAFFWTSQIIAAGFWLFFLVLNVLSLTFYWAIVDAVTFALCGINFMGFYKCRGEHKKKFEEYSQALQNQGMKLVAKEALRNIAKK